MCPVCGNWSTNEILSAVYPAWISVSISLAWVDGLHDMYTIFSAESALAQTFFFYDIIISKIDLDVYIYDHDN